MSLEDGSAEWMNPPPPGTSDDNIPIPKEKCSTHDKYVAKNSDKRYSSSPNQYYTDKSSYNSRSRSRERHCKSSRDKYREKHTRDPRYRSRSGSRKKYNDRRYTHKSYRNRHSRSRSRSYSRRYRKSYSRSRSPSIHKKRSARSSSYTSSSSSDQESYSRHKKLKDKIQYNDKLNDKTEDIEEEDAELVQENTFKNDGSFLEMFKKMQEEQAKNDNKTEQPEAGASEVKKLPMYGKRRGGKILKTGVVQKMKNPNELEDEPKDAWSVYMKEVRKYKEACCDDDSKTRPLVK